jgi:hypothetical protein
LHTAYPGVASQHTCGGAEPGYLEQTRGKNGCIVSYLLPLIGSNPGSHFSDLRLYIEGVSATEFHASVGLACQTHNQWNSQAE